jgi:quercetin dioxygenase-like cupin family protein
MAFNEPVIKNTTQISNPTTLSRLKEIKLIRWSGGQHPTLEVINRQMQAEGLRPYLQTATPNSRTGARSHGYTKVMYCVSGSLELQLPDISQSLVLRPGDRLELPQGVRHITITGANGAQIVESPLNTNPITAKN